MLKQLLTAKSDALLQAADGACIDKALVYDTIYFAVIKTKQKYKKLANKERAVEVCISLMKQPKRHVKQSFASVEDCIEKALAAKTVPWKPIVSAMAVVLAVAIILPFCLPEQSVHTDVDGFVMNNSFSLADRVGETGTYIKNIHSIPDLGGPDTMLLAGQELRKDGVIHYDLYTAQNGVTYLACGYTNGYLADRGKASAELILYRAETTGWVKIGSFPIASFSRTFENDMGIQSRFSIDPIRIVSDKNGVLYIISVYKEGVQIHQYKDADGLSLVDTVKIADYKNFQLIPGTYTTDWCTNFCVCYSDATNSFEIAIDTSSEDENSEIPHSGKLCFISYDIESQKFSEPFYHKESSVTNITADENGGLYFLSSEYINDSENPLDSQMKNRGHYLYYLNDGKVTSLGLITDPRLTSATQVPFFEYSGNKLHIVYDSGLSKKSFYVTVQNGEIISSSSISPSSSGATYSYIGYFLSNDALYVLELIDKEYLAFSRVTESKNKAIAEFALESAYYSAPYIQNRNGASLMSCGNVINILMNDAENNPYFFQIILK